MNKRDEREPVAGTWPRRRVLKVLAGVGAGAAFSRTLVSIAADRFQLTQAMIREAEWISGLEFSDAEREMMLEGVNDLLGSFASVRKVPLPNSVPPALVFQPHPKPVKSDTPAAEQKKATAATAVEFPESNDDLPFLPVASLAELIRTRQVSSVELTRLYLERLSHYDQQLECVITLTEELALKQAKRADRELASGRYHPTTWGAAPYQSQRFEEAATVAVKLADAGAVLIAKLSMGALAWGDKWFGGKTRNPWKPEEGSSGSSAGSASATAAGLVGFAIGTETWGSIVSPCMVCGTSGLRPSYGMVSRYGAMALSWSLDKIGPITRSVEDLALVFDAIRGPDGKDHGVFDRPFTWPPERALQSLRVGYVRRLFDDDRTAGIEDEAARSRAQEEQAFDQRTLATLRALGLNLVPIELPDSYPVEDVITIVGSVEWTAAFDELTRSGKDDLLQVQIANAWPNEFRKGQLIPAVEYVRANRIRTLIMQEMEQKIANVDVYLCPATGNNNELTNLTGHPSVVLPNGFRDSDGTPSGIVFTGQLYGESELLAVAHAYQQATGYQLKRPGVGVS
jgi:Asp-tRNA(Asn)/Glu-tRNA(Gln) amidotransferase A subunit family amidase